MSLFIRCKTCEQKYDATDGDLSKCPLCHNPTGMSNIELLDSAEWEKDELWGENK